ncbi:MAG: hypothetical protein AAB425_01255, partial [Bdellovibrionota bacterium]
YLCAKACRAYASAKGKTWSQDQCEEHCGMSCYDGDGNWCRNIVSATTSSVQTYFKDTVVDAANADTTSVNNADTYQRTANPHFAGGMVYEMIVGPMVSVCSGNMVYWQEGGVEFSHSDGVDTHAVYKTNSVYPGAPPERLMCSHRHMKQELFMRVGSSTPIVINGGLAF